MPRYLFRIDDVTDTMNQDALMRCLSLLKRHGFKPILGVIPANRDEKLMRFPPQPGFWEMLADERGRGSVTIALHGFNHAYHKSRRALLYRYGIGPQSEFSGLPADAQLNKIRMGINILEERGLPPELFMAPHHSFDKNTLAALHAAGIRHVTDGVGLFRYRRFGHEFYPVISGRPRRIPFGMTTICLHTDTMTEADFASLERFLKKNTAGLTFEEAKLTTCPFLIAPVMNFIVRVLFFGVKTLKRIRGRTGETRAPV